MDSNSKIGEVVAHHYKIKHFVGQGSLGAVFLAEDTTTKNIFALKIIPKIEKEDYSFYVQHLVKLKQNLTGISIPHLLIPIEIIETDEYFYLVYQYLPSVITLGGIIKKDAPLHPHKVFNIIEKIAEALDKMHTNAFIHGDVKPDNILISTISDQEIYLIDPGMVEISEEKDGVVLVGTYRFMHPILKSKFIKEPESISTTSARLVLKAKTGTYIDIYSLGLVSFEMLTGDINIPSDLTSANIGSILQAKNPWINNSSLDNYNQLVDLLFKMLSVQPNLDEISAKAISINSASLSNAFKDLELIVPISQEIKITDQNETTLLTFISQIQNQLNEINQSLNLATAAFIRSPEHLKTIGSSKSDDEVLEQIHKAFTDGSNRIKSSWKVAVTMAFGIFILIIVMAILAVAISIINGVNAWSIIFGGASVSLVIGTLIWIPSDRIFQATIITQQLDLIHIQTVNSFQSTTDLEQRNRILKAAREDLNNLIP